MYNTPYNCDYTKNNLGQRDYGSNNQNPEYYEPLTPDYEYGRVKDDKYLNIIPSIISPKIQDTNIFNFDFANIDIKETNDKNPKKNENEQNISNQKNKESENEEKEEKKDEKNKKEEKNEDEEIEAIIIKEEDVDFNSLLKLTDCGVAKLSKKITKFNNINKKANFMPKFIVIKDAVKKYDLGKKRKIKKKYKMRGYYKMSKHLKMNKNNKSISINRKIRNKTNKKEKKKEKENENYFNNYGMDNNLNIKTLFQNENIINSQPINRNLKYINNDYNLNNNNNLLNSNINNNLNNNFNNNMNNYFNNNSFKYFPNQQLPLTTNLINTKIVYKEDLLNNLDYKGNNGFNIPNEYKLKENIYNLSNIKKTENEDNIFIGTLNSPLNYIPQIFESKNSGTVIDGIEYGTLLVPKNYVEKIKKIINED